MESGLLLQQSHDSSYFLNFFQQMLSEYRQQTNIH